MIPFIPKGFHGLANKSELRHISNYYASISNYTYYYTRPKVSNSALVSSKASKTCNHHHHQPMLVLFCEAAT